jgi:tetratricopeptide (TPR) repeat protein
VPAARRDLAPVTRANRLVSRGLADLARAHFLKMSEIIGSDCNNAISYFERGVAWLDKKQYDNAINDFDEAIRLDPNDAYSYINRGVAWSGKKDENNAIKDYNPSDLPESEGPPLLLHSWQRVVR